MAETRELHMEYRKSGKTYEVSVFEKRRDAEGEIYYALHDRFHGKQKKRLIDWAESCGGYVYAGILQIVGKN